MINKPEQAGNYVLKKGDTIFLEGHEVYSLNILLKGKIDVFLSGFRIFSVDKNIFLGANDLLLRNKHGFSLYAAEDSSVYAYPARSPEQAWSLVAAQKDYGAYLVNSLYTMMNSSKAALRGLERTGARLKTISENLATHFWVLKEFLNFSHSPSDAFFREGLGRLADLRDNGIPVSPLFNKEFIETIHGNSSGDEGGGEQSPVEKKLEYYEHVFNLPADLRKSFFSADMAITSYHCVDEAECLDSLIESLKDAFSNVGGYFRQLYSESSECLYTSYLKAAEETAALGLDPAPLLQALEYIYAVIKDIVALYSHEYCHKCETDLAYLEHSLNNVKSAAERPSGGANGANAHAAGAGLDYRGLPEELKDSASKILEYSGIAESRAELLMTNLLAFRNMSDRLSTDDDARRIRSGVSTVFFEVYEAVFKRAYNEKDNSRLINMFLNYGFMDERLLTPEQVLTLYRLAGKETPKVTYPICNTREWLSKIYSMEKDPSINEFDQDYFDVFRELKKQGRLNDRDKQAYDADTDARLSHEVANMLRINHRLCFGQISMYFPILHKDIITRDIAKAVITPEKIQECLDKILEVDFSAFHRELHYFDQTKGIEKEIIMKPIKPDIILIPIYGSRAIMWQEITGRSRNTPGRFLLPMFTDEDPYGMILKLMGNFRWELCRTMMGTAWNDVTQSSLTSEYSDYVQFFKKNRDLSEEAKERLKSQIIKHHNRLRDIFTADYEIWINNESKGNTRLNKVVRGILFKHCPFPKPLREQLGTMPLFADMATQFRIQRNKIAKEVEGRYNRYRKQGIILDQDLEHNLAFYKDM